MSAPGHNPELVVDGLPRRRARWVEIATSADHKDLGRVLITGALGFLFIAVVELLLMRLQLAIPENTFLNPVTFNRMLSLYGATAIFFFAVPFALGFFYYVAPLQIGAYELPTGTFVMAAIAALHYREDLFPNPEEFRPERFLDGKPDTYAWIPFGGGVRRCIGAAFAEYEMRIVLRAILERAELSAPNEKPEKVKVRNITMAPGKGTLVRLDRPLS